MKLSSLILEHKDLHRREIDIIALINSVDRQSRNVSEKINNLNRMNSTSFSRAKTQTESPDVVELILPPNDLAFYNVNDEKLLRKLQQLVRLKKQLIHRKDSLIEQLNLVYESSDPLAIDEARLDKLKNLEKTLYSTADTVSKRLWDLMYSGGRKMLVDPPNRPKDNEIEVIRSGQTIWYRITNTPNLDKIKKLNELHKSVISRLNKVKRKLAAIKKQKRVQLSGEFDKPVDPFKVDMGAIPITIPTAVIPVPGIKISQIKNPYYFQYRGHEQGYAGHPLNCPVLTPHAKQQYFQLAEILKRNKLGDVEIMYSTEKGGFTSNDKWVYKLHHYVMIAAKGDIVLYRRNSQVSGFNKIWIGGVPYKTSVFFGLDVDSQDQIIKTIIK